MRKYIFLFVVLALTNIFVNSVSAQGQANLSGIKPNLAAGDIKSINQSENKITLSTTDGEIVISAVAATSIKRVPADKPVLSAAVDSTFSELSVGDKILATGAVSSDKKAISAAKAIYIISKADISKRDAEEREMWRTRGINGRVVGVDFATKQITVASRAGMMGTTNVVVTPKDQVMYYRYAPDSVKFADAKASSLAEIKAGDEIRVLGDKSEDGSAMKAERIISGSFKTIVGNITAIDTAKKEITIKEFSTNKPLTIVLKDNSLLKKLPAEMAAMMAMRQGGAATPASPGAANNGAGGNVTVRPPQTGGQSGIGGGRPEGGMRPGGGMGQGGGMRAGRDLDSMFERFEIISLGDLKVGEAIGVSSSGTASDRYTAIKLLSGIEPFLAAASAMQANGGRRNQGGQSPTIEIPGLEGGIGAP